MARSQRFDAAALKAAVVRAGLESGAGAVRVVSVGEDVRTRERLRRAIVRGDLATWRYDETYAERASDARAILPGARTAVCIAVPYATPAPKARGLRGRVSNYAWSRDYHRRLRPILEAIAHVLDAAAEEEVCAIALDTKPLAERALAASGGLGWVGKHTNLINPELGSFIFLGEVLTTLELPPDQPSRKSCGSCARCVDACPTGALRGDYTMDATRCISDLTQRTDAIPRAMRPLVGQWVWGCDLCQIACPPTQRATRQADDVNLPDSLETSAPDLLALLRLRSGAFARTYRGTAMGWRGAAVLRRNAAVALGNALDRAAVPTMVESLNADPHPLVRGHVAWALGRIGSPEALNALRTRADVEDDASVREEIGEALKPFYEAPR